jgi:hypothetical protein
MLVLDAVVVVVVVVDPNRHPLKVVGNEKVGRSGMYQSVPIWLRPRRSRFVCLLISLLSLILRISVSAPVKQKE